MAVDQSPMQENEDTIANFQFLVDKIVKTNDQPASLLLQKKISGSSLEVKDMLFNVALPHGMNLMKNRFGNFLMQKILELGTLIIIYFRNYHYLTYH